MYSIYGRVILTALSLPNLLLFIQSHKKVGVVNSEEVYVGTSLRQASLFVKCLETANCCGNISTRKLRVSEETFLPLWSQHVIIFDKFKLNSEKYKSTTKRCQDHLDFFNLEVNSISKCPFKVINKDTSIFVVDFNQVYTHR